jgi:hypothetical protein
VSNDRDYFYPDAFVTRGGIAEPTAIELSQLYRGVPLEPLVPEDNHDR